MQATLGLAPWMRVLQLLDHQSLPRSAKSCKPPLGPTLVRATPQHRPPVALTATKEAHASEREHVRSVRSWTRSCSPSQLLQPFLFSAVVVMRSCRKNRRVRIFRPADGFNNRCGTRSGNMEAVPSNFKSRSPDFFCAAFCKVLCRSQMWSLKLEAWS